MYLCIFIVLVIAVYIFSNNAGHMILNKYSISRKKHVVEIEIINFTYQYTAASYDATTLEWKTDTSCC